MFGFVEIFVTFNLYNLLCEAYFYPYKMINFPKFQTKIPFIFYLAICLIGSFALIASCNVPCKDPQTNHFTIQFLDANSEADTLTFVSIQGLGVDSVLYDIEDDTLSVFELPISANNESTYVFVSNVNEQEIRDTLQIAYQRRFASLGRDCFLVEEIFDLKILKNTFSSAEVKNNVLQNNAQNPEIFIHY
jgi:hypothetical protein